MRRKIRWQILERGLAAQQRYPGDRAPGPGRGRRPAAGREGAGKLYRARSRLYRGEILQENMRLKARAEIYTMHPFAQLCNLNFL